jgi:hypothetical protein
VLTRRHTLGNTVLCSRYAVGIPSTRYDSHVVTSRGTRESGSAHSMHCAENGTTITGIGRGRRCMIFAKMAGLLAMLALLPGGVLSG